MRDIFENAKIGDVFRCNSFGRIKYKGINTNVDNELKFSAHDGRVFFTDLDGHVMIKTIDGGKRTYSDVLIVQEF